MISLAKNQIRITKEKEKITKIKIKSHKILKTRKRTKILHNNRKQIMIKSLKVLKTRKRTKMKFKQNKLMRKLRILLNQIKFKILIIVYPISHKMTGQS